MIPYEGRVCPYCGADKSGDKRVHAIIVGISLAGMVVGGFIGIAAWGFLGFLAGIILGGVVGAIIGSAIAHELPKRDNGESNSR